jgi:hypothetical protein
MTDTIESRLAARNITLPEAAAPAANYLPYVITGSQLFISGQLPMESGALRSRACSAATSMSAPARERRSCARSTSWPRPRLRLAEISNGSSGW